MTRQTVRNAYRGVCPTEEEKEKMLHSVLEFRNLPEVETGEYRGKPMKTGAFSTVAAVLAAAAMLAVVVWFGKDYLLRGAEPVDPPTVEATESPEQQDGFHSYDEVLDLYITAKRDNSSMTECSEMGICSMSVDYAADQIGYTLLDLDGDRKKELIVAVDDEEQLILDIFTTQENGTVANVLNSISRDLHYLREGNLVLQIVEDTARVKYNYTVERIHGTSRTGVEQIIYSSRNDPDTPWYRQSDGTYLAEAEAMAVVDSYPPQPMELKKLPGLESVIESMKRYGTASEQYLEAIDKYLQAVTKKWDAAALDLNGLSTLGAGLDASQIGYRFQDLDGDGTQELIFMIDDESQTILDVYSQFWGMRSRILSSSDKIQYYLREAGTIFSVQWESQTVIEYGFWKLNTNGWDLVQQDRVRYDADENPYNPWFVGFDLRQSTDTEALERLDTGTIEHLELIRLSDLLK